MSEKAQYLISIREKYKNLIEIAGNEGKYQYIVCFLMIFVSYISGFISMLIPLHKILPEYLCVNKNDYNNSNLKDFDIYKKDLNRFRTFIDSKCVSRYCKIQEVVIVDYHSYTNFITQLDLFCDDEFFIYFTQFIFLGRIIGMILYSFISDKNGRLLCYYIILYLQLFSLIGYIFFNKKFLIIFFSTISNSTLYLWTHTVVISSETMCEKLYSSVGALTSLAFSLSGIINIIIMYFYKNWFIVLYYYLIMTIIVLYFSHLYMTETPKFLLENEKLKEFKTTLIKILNINFTDSNRKTAFESELKKIESKHEFEILSNDFCIITNKKETLMCFISKVTKSLIGPYLNLMNSYEKAKNIFSFSLIFISTLCIYYGQLIYIEALPGDLLTNLSIIYISEIVINLFASYIVQRNERKYLMKICICISGINCFLIVIFKNIKLFLIINIFSLTCFNSISIVALYVFMSETIDINLKSMTISTCLIVSNAAFLILPYLILIFENPYLIFGVLSLLSYLVLIN